ncbi:hypothetical protein THRCLA_00019 [Thraustotheca clavata]|uniref:Uncharacterized protein n=1 Tax=Thraustotheca clavata TaxID=74557 RepID=A0A1W0ACX8_9STRA|nr:hypothetical protein THRCLA_00019 [Thraustotheca clavata]
MKRSPSPYAIESKRPRHEDTFEYMGMDIDMNQLSMDGVYCHETADESDEELDSTVAALVAGINPNDDGLLPMMPVNVHLFTPIEVSVADTVRASQSPDRLTLSPVTEARILARCYYLKLHESAFHRLRRSQRQAMQAAGLIHIPINSTCPKVTFTREWLTRDGMADIYGPYKQYLSRKGSVTIDWIQEYVRTEIFVTNESKNNVFIDTTRLAPQSKMTMQPGETVKILTTPYEQRVILGYTLYEGLLEAPPHGLAHNCISVLLAHPLAYYRAFGMSLAGLEYRAMLTELVKNVESSASVSQGINDGAYIAT